jgi:hypothetical protein
MHFQNHAVRLLGMVPLADSMDKGSAETIETIMTEVTGLKCNQIMTAMISDLAAKGIAREFDQEVGEWCDICIRERSDKIAW